MIKFLKNIYSYDKERFEACSNDGYRFRVILTSLILCCIGLVCSIFFTSVIGSIFHILVPTGLTLSIIFGTGVFVLLILMIVQIADTSF